MISKENDYPFVYPGFYHFCGVARKLNMIRGAMGETGE